MSSFGGGFPIASEEETQDQTSKSNKDNIMRTVSDAAAVTAAAAPTRDVKEYHKKLLNCTGAGVTYDELEKLRQRTKQVFAPLKVG